MKLRLGAFALLCTLSTVKTFAAPFDAGAQPDFREYFSITGYGANTRFTEPSALALDERNRLIYIADQKAGVVSAFSLQGVAKFQYGAANGLKAPIGLAVDRAGDVFVSENDGGPIKIIDSKGEVSTLELPDDKGYGKDPPKTGRIAIDRDDNLCVVDRANCQVFVFDKDRKFKLKFGGVGDKRGQFKLIQDVAFDKQGRIYVTDAVGTAVQVFDRNGAYIYGFGAHGEADDAVSFPAGVFVDRHDQVWVVDKPRHSLKVFNRSGLFLRSFGAYGQGEGSLFYPVAAAQDALGRVYVLEFGARRLQVFTLNRPFEPFS
ncbi:MAG TPA: NHL repeat-containing protein [Armatimonadota bacterium]